MDFSARWKFAYTFIRPEGWTIAYWIELRQWMQSVSRTGPSESSRAWGKLRRHSGQEMVTHVSGAEP